MREDDIRPAKHLSFEVIILKCSRKHACVLLKLTISSIGPNTAQK